MQLRHTKNGLLKHAAAAFILLLACHYAVFAGPVIGFLAANWIAIAISASLAAASMGLSFLLQPKPKPFDKNKLQGEIQLTSIGEDIPITDVSGAAPGDGIGGIKVGGTIIHANDIRRTVITVPGQSTGGGKGAPKPPPQREYHYFIDLAIIVGRGPLRIKQIKAQQDIIYQGFTQTPVVSGTTYEAEDATSDSGGTSTVADGDMSGGFKVNLDQNEWVQWNNIVAAVVDVREIYIDYKSSQDIDIEFTVNGTMYREVLPDSFGIRNNVNLPRELLVSSSNVIRIKNMTNAVLSLDRVVIGLLPIFQDDGDGDLDGDGCYLSGLKYEGWTNPEPTYDPYTLREVYEPDDRGCELWNYQANANALGEVSAAVISNANVRIYPGNQTQLPDPMLQEYFEGVYGAGSTPAYRGRCYVVLENFEITKYGTVPNFTFVAEHETINSLGEMYDDLAERAGLESSEYDFTDLYAVPLRGYAITEKRAPAKSMEILGRVFDIDVYEDFDGVIKGIIPNETVLATIEVDEADVQEGKDVSESSNKPHTPVITNFRDETELPYFLDVSYFDPSKDWETRNVHALREVESNDRKANIETGLVMTETEAQKFAERDLHKQYVEKDGIEVNTFHKYSWLAPTNLIRVTDTDGTTPRMRIKVMEGWIPGTLKIQGVSRDADEFPERVFVVANPNPVVPTVRPPAPIIGTFIDLATFREETTAGFYAVAALTDTHYQWRGAGLFREIEDDWEALDGIPNEGTLGLTISGVDGTLGDAPAPPLPDSPIPPAVTTLPTGGSINIAKSRRFKITYYDGTDESLPSGATPIITVGTTSTITVESPAASAGATHYRVYVSNAGGPYELQNGAGTAIATDLTLTSLTTGTAQPPSIWDETNTVEFDLYNGEVETLTDEQVLEGRNFLVVGNEIIQFATATRDNNFPSRWVIERFQRGVMGTAAAAVDHTDSERVVLYTQAWRWIVQDPGLANVDRTYKFLASGDDLEKAWSTVWSWDGHTQYNTSVYETVDNGVPVLSPDPPVLATEGDFLRVLIQRPIRYGYTADRAQVRVRADDDDALIRTLETSTADVLILAPTEDANVDYRWQNRYRQDGSDGWSEWSASELFDFGTPPPPPPPFQPPGDPPGPGDLESIGCFIDGTLVLMADWTEKPIEQITTRDYVMAWNHAGRILPGKVIDVMQKEMPAHRDLMLSDDRVGVTETHPFLPDFERKMAVKDMEPGQKLRAYKKGWHFVEVVSAENILGPVKVNNLEVAVWHSYFVRQNGNWKAVYNLSAKQGQSMF